MGRFCVVCVVELVNYLIGSTNWLFSELVK